MQAAPGYLRTIKTEQVFCRLSGTIERSDSDKFYTELKTLLKKHAIRCIFQDGSELWWLESKEIF